MNLLQIARYPAYPPKTGGQRRVHGLVAGRRPDDQIHRFVHAPVGGERDGARTVEIDSNYSEYRYPNYPNSVLGFLTNRFDAPQVFAAMTMRYWPDGPLSSLSSEADVILVEGPWQFPYVQDLATEETILVYSSHNFELERFSHLQSSTLTRPIYERIRALERTAVAGSDLVVVTSDRDASRYREMFDESGRFHVAHNAASMARLKAADTTAPAPLQQIKADATIALFVGSHYQPNIEAVKFLVDIADTLSETIQILVVGTVCESFDTDSVPENIHLLGFVNDIDAVYAAADIGLNPITSGGGTNVKLAEYFAHGLPVVTTPFGAAGLPGDGGESYIVTELASFCKTLAVVKDGAYDLDTIGKNARHLSETCLNWRTVSRKLLERIDDLL